MYRLVMIFFNLIRAKQYVKNLLIFAPLFFAQGIFSKALFVKLAIAFVGFSLMASFIYILNDIKDLDYDKKHLYKCKRPIASGEISKNTAIVFAVLCLVLGCLLLVWSGSLVYAGIYIVINLLYVFKLKNYAILDILIIALCYIIRLFVGSQVTNIVLSHWIIIITFLLALFLAISKRYDDLKYSNKEDLRTCISGYNCVFIENTMSILAGIIVVAYILYTISPDVIAQYNCSYLYTTALFVLIGILRYLQIVFVYKKSDSPTNIIYNDFCLKLVVVLWIVVYICIIYL